MRRILWTVCWSLTISSRAYVRTDAAPAARWCPNKRLDSKSIMLDFAAMIKSWPSHCDRCRDVQLIHSHTPWCTRRKVIASPVAIGLASQHWLTSDHPGIVTPGGRLAAALASNHLFPQAPPVNSPRPRATNATSFLKYPSYISCWKIRWARFHHQYWFRYQWEKLCHQNGRNCKCKTADAYK